MDAGSIDGRVERGAAYLDATSGSGATRRGVNAKAPRFKLLTFAELRSQPAPVWRVQRVIPRQGVVVIYGASGSGKTFAALDLACSISRGVPWSKRRTSKGTVAYIAAEGNLRERVEAYAQHHGLSDDDLAGLRVLDSAVNLLSPTADVEELIASLCALADETGSVAAVFIDTLNRVMPGGDENSGADMGRIVAAATRIAIELKCAVIFIHHSGKDESKGSRGHSSLKAATDAEISVKRNGDVRTITAEKVRDGADGEALLAFRLEVVDLGPASDGDPDAGPDERLTSCVVVPTSASAPTATARLSDIDEIALCALRTLCSERGERTSESSLHPAGRPVASVDEWRERFRRERGVDTADDKSMEASRKAFQRAVDKLKKLQLIGIDESRVWPC